MKLTIFFLLISVYSYAQTIDRRVQSISIADTSCFFNMEYELVFTSKKTKINLKSSDGNTEKFNTIILTPFQFKNLTSGETYGLKVLDDSDSLNPMWTINVKVGNSVEDFTLVPIQCEDDYLILNVIGVKKVKKNKSKSGYLETLVYKKIG